MMMHKKNAGTLASAIFLRLAAQSFEFVLIPKREVLDFRRNLKPGISFLLISFLP